MPYSHVSGCGNRLTDSWRPWVNRNLVSAAYFIGCYVRYNIDHSKKRKEKNQSTYSHAKIFYTFSLFSTLFFNDIFNIQYYSAKGKEAKNHTGNVFYRNLLHQIILHYFTLYIKKIQPFSIEFRKITDITWTIFLTSVIFVNDNSTKITDTFYGYVQNFSW